MIGGRSDERHVHAVEIRPEMLFPQDLQGRDARHAVVVLGSDGEDDLVDAFGIARIESAQASCGSRRGFRASQVALGIQVK